MSEAYETYEDQKQYSFHDWVKQHKKPIIVGCCVVVATVTGVLIYKEWSLPKNGMERLKPLHQLEKEALSQPLKIECPDLLSVDPITKLSVVEVATCLNGGEPFEVSKHIRNLPNNRQPSTDKVLRALENGIELSEHQTWVDNYIKNQVA
jgi:hypothetical protein